MVLGLFVALAAGTWTLVGPIFQFLQKLLPEGWFLGCSLHGCGGPRTLKAVKWRTCWSPYNLSVGKEGGPWKTYLPFQCHLLSVFCGSMTFKHILFLYLSSKSLEETGRSQAKLRFKTWQKTWPILGAFYMAAGVAHFTAAEAFESIYPPEGTWGFWYLPGSAAWCHGFWSRGFFGWFWRATVQILHFFAHAMHS